MMLHCCGCEVGIAMDVMLHCCGCDVALLWV